MASAPESRAASTIASPRRYDSDGEAPPRGTASSASTTKGSFRSGSEKTATVAIPISRQVRKTRRAISPRFATRTLRIVFTRRSSRSHAEHAEARAARDLGRVHGGESEAENGTAVPGVDDAGVPDQGGRIQGE